MEFLDKVKKTVSSVAKVSSRESKKLYSITRLKLEITDKKNKEKNLFKEIGFTAYKAHIKGQNITKRIKPILEEIDAIEDSIAILRNRVDLIKDSDDLEYEDFVEEAFDADFEEVEESEEEEIIDEETSEDEQEELETESIEPIE